MKKNILILLLFCVNIGFSQNTRIEFDEIIPKYILELWNNKGEVKSQEFNNSELDQIKLFFEELKKKENEITSQKFLTKPTDNTLLAYYIHIKLQWNMFNPAVKMKRLKNEKVVKNILKNIPDRYELLAFYYSAIFIDVLNKRKPMNLADTNIDLENLNLNDDTEKTILFLSAMRHVGYQVTSYATSKSTGACERAIKYVTNMPEFNGKSFYEFKLPEFNDFKIEVDKRYPKMSFKERYIPEFENAKSGYKNCIETKN